MVTEVIDHDEDVKKPDLKIVDSEELMIITKMESQEGLIFE